MVRIGLGDVVLDLIASVVLGSAALAWLSPLALYWWIHGDDERYLWIIQGPAPYSNFGGGPAQAAMGIALIGLATVLTAAGVVLKWWQWRRLDAEFVL